MHFPDLVLDSLVPQTPLPAVLPEPLCAALPGGFPPGPVPRPGFARPANPLPAGLSEPLYAALPGGLPPGPVLPCPLRMTVPDRDGVS